MPLDMAVILGDLVADGRVAAFETPDRFYEIGKPEGLAELDAWLGGRS
jgi:NDP-sugar pyrophosphorylase family protein